MKLTLIFFIAACLGAGASGYTQSITLSMKKAPLENVFKAINRQTGYDFAYNDDVKAKALSIDIKVAHADIHTTLTKCFEGLALTYTLSDNTIIVKVKNSSVNDLVASPTPIDVSGRIVNEAGEPVIATIAVKGTKNAVSTDLNGFFLLKGVKDDAVLVITGVNIDSKEIRVNGMSNLSTITTTKKTIEITGVTVQGSTGLEAVDPARRPGSYTVISNDLLNKTVGTDIISRMAFLAPGVLYQGGTDASSLLIRNRTTIFSNPNPLIIVDNFPYYGDLLSINPNDVENITVLKDAAAASIWGKESANGVVVITTKNGKYNQRTSVSINSNISITQKDDLFSAPQINVGDYIDVERFLFDKGYFDGNITAPHRPALTPAVEILLKRRNGQLDDATANSQLDLLKRHDWRSDKSEYFLQAPIRQQYAVNLSGGSANQKYYVSFGWDQNRSKAVGNDLNRFTLNANNTYSLIKGKVEIISGITYTQTKSEENETSRGGISYPYARIADENGNALAVARYRQGYLDTAGAGKLLDWNYRPLDELRLSNDVTRGTRYRVNLGLKVKIVNGLYLDVKGQYGKELTENKDVKNLKTFYARDYINRFYQPGAANKFPVPVEGGILDSRSSVATFKNIRTQVDYNKSWGKDHDLSFLAGGEIRENIIDGLTLRFYGYNEERGTDMPVEYVNSYRNYATGSFEKISRGSDFTSTDERNVSIFGNFAYTFKNRYTFSGSARKDASNVLGVETNKKWQPLWSAGASWDISEESFYHIDWLERLRFRATYGYQGNINTTIAAVLTILQSLPNRWNSPVTSITNTPNPYLRWEKTGTMNFGLDYTVKGGIISGSIEYYRRKGIDLMGTIPLPPSTGNSGFLGNTSDMKGEGFELSVESRNLNGAIKWTTGFQFSYARDWVTIYKEKSLALSEYVAGNGLPIEGRPVQAIYSYPWAGLDPAGDPQGYLNKVVSKDYSAIGSIKDLSQMVYHGPANPPFYGGLRNSIDWKGLSLYFNIAYKFGYYFRRSSINYSALFEGNDFGHKDYYNRWKNPGDEQFTDIPSMIYPASASRDKFYQQSEVLVEKGDHVRLRDIRLSYNYTHPALIKKLGLRSIVLYANVNNLGIIWRANKLKIDPDVGQNISTINVPKTFSVGIKIDF